MVEHTQVARSKRIQRRTGKTFHVATRLLPKRIRHATYVLYGFFRIADEVVDAEDTDPPAEQRAELDRLRRAALGEQETDDPVLEAFAEVKAEHGIADGDIPSFVDAMESGFLVGNREDSKFQLSEEHTNVDLFHGFLDNDE